MALHSAVEKEAPNELRPAPVADEKHSPGSINDFDITREHDHDNEVAIMRKDYEDKPTDEEFATLRRVPGKIPTVAYLLCAVEFCERASYYGRSGHRRR